MANAAPFDYYRCRHEDFTSRREALNALIVEHETAWNQLTVDDKLHVCTVLHNTAQNLLQELQNAEGDSRYKEFQETYKSDIHHYTLISELVREQAQPELTWSNV